MALLDGDLGEGAAQPCSRYSFSFQKAFGLECRELVLHEHYCYVRHLYDSFVVQTGMCKVPQGFELLWRLFQWGLKTSQNTLPTPLFFWSKQNVFSQE